MAGKAESPPQKSSKKNEQLNEAFVLTFQEQVETAILEKQTTLPRVRLFCQDESRLGLLPVVQRRITSCGVKPVALVDSQYDWFYLYGAVEPLTGDGCFLELERESVSKSSLMNFQQLPTALIVSFSIMDAFIMPSRW